MNRSIVILVMAEEKWEEADFLRQQIELIGHRAKILDMGLTGSSQGVCQISREEVISASGRPHEEVLSVTDRGKRMPIMVDGGIQIVRKLFDEGELSGIISVGGTTGTRMGSSIMKSLPFGFPKLAVSSTAALPGLSSRYIGTADITLMHSVIEFAGLNDLLRNVLARAAGAICAMVESGERVPIQLPEKGNKPLIAMTHFGPSEECAVHVRKLLEEKGWQVIGFSAAGIGDRAMEEIIESRDIFGAVIDLTPGGVGEELFGFSRKAGPTRLEAAGKKNLPQVIAPCSVNFGSPLKKNYLPEYDQRKKYVYDSARTFVRLSEEELIQVADVIAEKLNRSGGPVKVVIPLGGWSSVDKRGTPFYDANLDRIFVDQLKKKLSSAIEVREVDADLETLEFASAVVQAFEDIMPKEVIH
ncbi:MAG TPA: Tm-1-like ATP-binding domain-containing protein [Desulfobacteraceae bacterium]|nr:Tm-1-like ATP-binding domain-containing protein [Desulfobacteraceae bacterium]